MIDTCQHAGIRVPHDIAVLGSNYDKLLSAASCPPQAGIQMAVDQIGLTAARLLDEMMHGKTPKKKEWLLEPRGVIEKLSIDTLAVQNPHLVKTMTLLLEHALEPICIEDLLKKVPMARRSLERKFRQTFGCSILEQVRQLRINHARRLLADTDIPITLIAEQRGVSSYTYMNRVFKQVTGTSPSQYRAQFRFSAP